MEKENVQQQEKIRALIAFIAEGKRQGKTLSRLFEEYAARTGKAKGSVRNDYYAVLAEGQKNAGFYKDYLEGSDLRAEKIQEFSEAQTDSLIRDILTACQDGKSVRAAIRDLSGGDEKIALRYQNKYRNVLTHGREKMLCLAKEVEGQTGKPCRPYGKRDVHAEVQERLRAEIDGLVRRISLRIKQENRELKERVGRLESENLRLKMALRGESATPMLFLDDVRNNRLH